MAKLCPSDLTYKNSYPLSHFFFACAPRYTIPFSPLLPYIPPHSCVVSRIRVLISVTPVPCCCCGVRPLNCAFSRARAGILVHIFPSHGISNGNENSLKLWIQDGRCGQRPSPGNSLPTASASLRLFSPLSRDSWSRQLPP